MPAAFSHIVLLDEVANRLSDATLKNLLTDFPQHAAFGCLGPDILFFESSATAYSVFQSAIEKVIHPIELAIKVFNEVRDNAADIITHPFGQRWQQLSRDVQDFATSTTRTINFFVGSVTQPSNFD